MPTVSATIDVATTTPSESIFRSVYTITSVLDFPDTSLLVCRYSDDAFDRVATIYDLSAWPTVKTIGMEYYRQATVTVDYDSLEVGGRAVLDIPARIEALVTAYALYKGVFETDFVSTYTGSY